MTQTNKCDIAKNRSNRRSKKEFTKNGRNFDIIQDILQEVFKGLPRTNIEKFLKITAKMNKMLLEPVKNKKIYGLIRNYFGVYYESSFSLIDIILLGEMYEKRIEFSNICTHFKDIIEPFNAGKQNWIRISYEKNTRALSSIYSGNFEINEKNKRKLFKKVIKEITSQLRNSKISFIYELDKRIRKIDDVVRIKRKYSKRKDSEERIEREETAEKISGAVYEGDLECYVDLDAFWTVCPTNEAKHINGSFNIVSKIVNSCPRSIGKKYYVAAAGKAVFIKNLINFKIGSFILDRDFSLHVYAVCPRYLRTSGEKTIKYISREVNRALRNAYKELVAKSEHNRYLLARNNESRILQSTGTRLSAKIEESFDVEAFYENREFRKHIPKAVISDFFELLSSETIFKTEIKALHIESCGNKRYFSCTSIREVYHNLDTVIDLEKLKFIRIDIAMTYSMAGIEAEEQEILYVKTEKDNAFNVRPKSVMCSSVLSNINASLIDISNSRLRIHRECIERVNIYSCFFTEIFPRQIRTSSSCQLTSRVLFENMRRATEPNIDHKPGHVLKSLLETKELLSQRNEGNFPFRFEFNGNLFVCGQIIGKIKKEIKKENILVIKSGKLKNYLLSLTNKLLNLAMKKNIVETEYLDIIALENLFFESYVKGSGNIHILPREEVKTVFKSLIYDDYIPLHDIEAIKNKIINKCKYDQLEEYLQRAVRYAVSVPLRQREEVAFFVGIICEALHEKVLEQIVAFYCYEVANIKEERASRDTQLLLPEVFATEFINLNRFVFFSRKSKLFYILSYVKKYKKDWKELITAKMTSMAERGEVPAPYEKGVSNRYLQKYRFLPAANQSIRTAPSQVSENELAVYIKNNSYTRRFRVSWSLNDVHRLNAAIMYYASRGVRDAHTRAYYDVRFCFYGALPIEKFKEKIKSLKKIQRRFTENFQGFHFLGLKYLDYNVDHISFDVVKMIYLRRYEVSFQQDLEEKLKEKFTSYYPQESIELRHLPIESESLSCFIPFYEESEQQPPLNSLDSVSRNRLRMSFAENMNDLIDEYERRINNQDERLEVGDSVRIATEIQQDDYNLLEMESHGEQNTRHASPEDTTLQLLPSAVSNERKRTRLVISLKSRRKEPEIEITNNNLPEVEIRYSDTAHGNLNNNLPEVEINDFHTRHEIADDYEINFSNCENDFEVNDYHYSDVGGNTDGTALLSDEVKNTTEKKDAEVENLVVRIKIMYTDINNPHYYDNRKLRVKIKARADTVFEQEVHDSAAAEPAKEKLDNKLLKTLLLKLIKKYNKKNKVRAYDVCRLFYYSERPSLAKIEAILELLSGKGILKKAGRGLNIFYTMKASKEEIEDMVREI